MKNQPAFPQPEPIFNEFHKDYGKDRGMSLRDYFAAKAMQGLLSNRNAEAAIDEFAVKSYRMADAMMKARQA
jgi:hypothetical protein